MTRHAASALLAFIAIVALSATAHAQCNPCMSAGIKLGHTFGKDGGFTWGIEGSVSSWDWRGMMEPVLMQGVVMSYDQIAGERGIFHIGYEVGTVVSIASAGIDFGPSVVFSDTDRSSVGFTISPFVGAFTVFPFYSVTVADDSNIEQMGVTGKFPFVTDTINL